MNQAWIILLLIVLIAPNLRADEVVYATEEDLNAFDQMLAPPEVEFEVLPESQNTQTVEIDTQSVEQRGNYGLIISDKARQLAPQRSVAPGTNLRGVHPDRPTGK